MTCAEAKSYLEEFIPLIKNIKDDRKVIIAPPITAISTFSDHTDFCAITYGFFDLLCK